MNAELAYKLAMSKIFYAVALLLAGLVAYWLLRPNIWVFDALGLVNADADLAATGLHQVFSNYFADAAWCGATVLIAAYLLDRGSPRVYPQLLLVLPFVSEALQGLGAIPGTFDWLDVLVYAVIVACYFTWEATHMNRLKTHFVGAAAVAVLLGALIGSASTPQYVYQTGTFFCAPKNDEVFSKPSLAKILQTSNTKKLAVVLRVPVSGEKVTEEQRRSTDMLYNTIDKELAKAGFIVRDRALFGKVLDQQNLDYSKIGQLTETDLILELVSYRADHRYTANRYRDENGVEKEPPAAIEFRGPSIEFKVVSVKENDFIASYTFYNTPCAAKGCVHRFSATSPSSWTATPGFDAETVYRDFAARLIAKLKS